MTDYLDKFSLQGKKAVVVGGLGLIGRAAVDDLAQAGARVVAADIDETKPKEFLASARKYHKAVTLRYLDITDGENLQRNVSDIINDLKGVDIWVTAAYPRTADWGAGIEQVSIDSWRTNVDMQLNVVAMCCAWAAKAMKAKGGSIINLGSIYGVVGGNFRLYEQTKVKPVSMIYSAVKGGLINLGRTMASYWGKYNIRVNTVCPGGVFDNQDRRFLARYNRQVPLGRMAKPEDVAGAILFLASEASSYITGTVFMVDGGWTAV